MDPQQRRVYRWEGSFRFFCERTARKDDLRKLIAKASRRYGVEAPTVRFKTKAETTGRITSEYDPDDHSISLGWNDCNRAIALHEAAHAIADSLYGPFQQAHGSRWLGIYMELLEWDGIAPRSALHASAKEKRLKWNRRRALNKGR